LKQQAGKGNRYVGQNTVRLYTLSTCSHCRAAKRFLDENGIAYDFTDVDLLSGEEKQRAVEEVRKLNPRCSYPTIVLGENRVIVGFRETELREALEL